MTKTHRICFRGMGQTNGRADRQTDGETDGMQHRLMPSTPSVAGADKHALIDPKQQHRRTAVSSIDGRIVG